MGAAGTIPAMRDVPPVSTVDTRLRLRRLLVIAAVVMLILAACSSEEPEETTPTTTVATTTTTTLPTTPIDASGFDWIPAATGECAVDMAAAEGVMVESPLSEIDTEEHHDAFAELLRALMIACRTDVMERWAIETYHPWLRGEKVTAGRVPVDVSEWPQEWIEERSPRSEPSTPPCGAHPACS